MRTLERNKRTIYYAQQKERVEITDDYGNLTGEYTVAYTQPQSIRLNVGSEGGSGSLEEYGVAPPGTRTLVTDDLRCPITELSVLWIDVPITEAYNYVVKSVCRSLNSVKIIVARVENR